jgi:hypothetical protein
MILVWNIGTQWFIKVSLKMPQCLKLLGQTYPYTCHKDVEKE